MTSPPYVILRFAVKINFVQVCRYNNIKHSKQLNHSNIFPTYAMQVVHLALELNNRTKTII